MNRLIVVIAAALPLAGCAISERVRIAQDCEAKGQLIQAVDLYREALAEGRRTSDKERIQRRMAALLPSITNAALVEAESTLGLGHSLADYSNATDVLEPKIRYDDGTRIADRLEEYRSRAQELTMRRSRLLDDVSSLVESGQWTPAVRNLQAARRIEDTPELESRQRAVLRQRDEYYARVIDSACDTDDWRTCDSLLAAFRDEDPPPARSRLDAFSKRVEQTKAQRVSRDVEALRAEKKYFTAYTLIEESGVGGLDAVMTSIRRDGSQHYLDLGKQALAGEKPFRAYIAAVKAKTLDPDRDEIFKFHRDREDEVDAAIQLQVGVAKFDSPELKGDAGAEFSDELISFLIKQLPYGVNIVERAKIDEAIRSSGADSRNEEKVGAAAELLGIHLAIVGNVSLLDVHLQEYEQKLPHRLKVGTKTEPNPQYESYLRRYGAKTANWPRVPPATVETDEYLEFEYKTGEVRMHGVMRVSVRIFTTSEGAITASESFETTYEKTDAFRDAVPGTDIERDPLELPTKLSAEQEMRRENVSKALAWLLSAFAHREGRFCEAGAAHVARREFEEAIAEFAKGYLYCLRAGIPENDKWARRIRQQVFYELTEASE